MKTKPIFFQVLCLFFLIEPLIKVTYFKVMTEFSLPLILSNIFTRNSIPEILSFWLAFPILGLFLIKIRRWSYFTFLALLGLNLYSLLTYERFTWPYNSEAPFHYNYFLIGLSLLVMLAFILPVIREPFFNDKIRWWETRKRFLIDLPIMVKDQKNKYSAQLYNISYSGALIKGLPELEINQELELELKYKNISLILHCCIIRKHKAVNWTGYGVAFRPKSLDQRYKAFKLIKRIEKDHYEITQENEITT